MELPEDNEFLYIAVEGLKAPVPAPWRTLTNAKGEISYFNSETGAIQPEHPLDEHFKQRLKQEKEIRRRRGGAMGQQLGNLGGGGGIMGPTANEEAQLQQMLNRQKEILEREYQESLEQIDKNFNLKKQEILKQNEQELEAEKQKWEMFLREEERKLKLESDMQVENQISLFKEKLHQEEERERLQIQKDADAQLRQFEKELEEKLEREKQTLVESYERIRKTIEENEKQRYEFELEKFKKDQGRTLDSKKVDIEKLKTEKRKVQSEYNEQVENLRKEMEKKLERERKLLQDQLRSEIEQIEKEEEQKYERKLEQMKREMLSANQQTNIDLEIQQFKQELEEEMELELRNYKKQLDEQLQQEEEKLEKKRQRELKEYEQMLSDQNERELKRKQQKVVLTKESEERELALIKLRIDQLYQDQLESFRKQQQIKYEKERRLYEDEKRRRMQDVQASIDKLNIATSDKEKLRKEIDNLNKEQKELQARIAQHEEDLEQEKGKKRQIEREINELNIQLNSKKVIGGESQRVLQLKEDISKKQREIQNAQRQYKDLLESKLDSPQPAGYKEGSVAKLEQEMKSIKEMLSNITGSKVSADSKFQSLLDQLESADKENSQLNSRVDEETTMLKELISKEKSEIQELEKRIQEDKAKYLEDKRANDDLKYSDPTAYRQKNKILLQVKESIDKKIQRINERITKVKDLEQQLRA